MRKRVTEKEEDNDIIGYDLAAFFERNKNILKREVEVILENLLTPK